MNRFFYSYEQLEKDIQKLQKKFPLILHTDVPEVSVDGRNIWKLTVGDVQAENHILIHGGIHGREYLNCAVLMRLLEEHLRECQKGGILRGTSFSDVCPAEICFHVLPMINPDGCTVSQTGTREMKRPELREFLQKCWEEAARQARAAGQRPPEPESYFARWKANARGVDLNRNFDAGWAAYGGPQTPGAQGYKGEFPGSEPETKAILEIQKKQPLKCCISYHSSGSLIYWDYGSENVLLEKERRLARILGKTLGYPLHSAVSDGTDQAGCSDYFVLKCGIPAVTIETGATDCPLPAWEFEKIFQENRGMWNALEHYCRSSSFISER